MLAPNIYLAPPSQELELKSFRTCGQKRIRILQDLENEVPQHRASALRRMAADSEFDAKTDVASHFLLRLALCKEAWQREWLLGHERRLLKLRFSISNYKERNEFLAEVMKSYCEAQRKREEEEGGGGASSSGSGEVEVVKRMTREELSQVLGPRKAGWYTRNMVVFYEMPFEAALDLLRDRLVVLAKGRAFVPEPLLFTFACSWFSSRLRKHLLILRRASQGVRRDERVSKVLRELRKLVRHPPKYKCTGVPSM
eukprot:jgi/Bigna1/83582/fgenesh1_pg.111_\